MLTSESWCVQLSFGMENKDANVSLMVNLVITAVSNPEKVTCGLLELLLDGNYRLTVIILTLDFFSSPGIISFCNVSNLSKTKADFLWATDGVCYQVQKLGTLEKGK